MMNYVWLAIAAGALGVLYGAVQTAAPVSYTHLTLPTN